MRNKLKKFLVMIGLFLGWYFRVLIVGIVIIYGKNTIGWTIPNLVFVIIAGLCFILFPLLQEDFGEMQKEELKNV